MTTLTLSAFTINSDNPFNEYPDLFSIWEPDLAIIAKEAIDEYVELSKEHPDADLGRIFIITAPSNKTVGLTGYFPSKEDFSEFTLRWHGMLPEYCGLGYSKKIINILTSIIKDKYPNAKKLIEIMPSDKPILKSYFKKLGFIQDGEEFKIDWSTKDWQSYSLTI